MVPPASHKLTGVRGTQECGWAPLACPYRTLTCCGGAFQRLRVSSLGRLAAPTTPCGPTTTWFGLFPPRSPLLRESRLISLRQATEMFQFAHCPPSCLCIQQAVSRHHSGWVAPFGFSGLFARMQLPLNVSPVSASFLGLQRLGIHLVLSLACVCWYPSCSCWLACYRACERCHLAPLLSSQRGPGTHTSRSSASLLSSCLGNIEVIMLCSCSGYICQEPRHLKSGNQPACSCLRCCLYSCYRAEDRPGMGCAALSLSLERKKEKHRATTP